MLIRQKRLSDLFSDEEARITLPPPVLHSLKNPCKKEKGKPAPAIPAGRRAVFLDPPECPYPVPPTDNSRRTNIQIMPASQREALPWESA